MNLFFAYVLAVCPELHDVIMILFWTSFIFFSLASIAFFCADIRGDKETANRAGNVILYFVKAVLVLLLLSALVPSQKRLNAMILNYHATYDARNDYGVPQGDK